MKDFSGQETSCVIHMCNLRITCKKYMCYLNQYFDKMVVSFEVSEIFPGPGIMWDRISK